MVTTFTVEQAETLALPYVKDASFRAITTDALVRVTGYGYGATKEMIGRTGVVIKVNRSRVVVLLDTYTKSGMVDQWSDRSIAIGGPCLTLVESAMNAGDADKLYPYETEENEPMETCEPATMATMEPATMATVEMVVDAAMARRHNAIETKRLDREVKRNARNNSVAVPVKRTDGIMPNDCMNIARSIANRNGMFSSKEIHDSAVATMALAKVGTERNAAYRHLLSGQYGRNDLATFRSVARKWTGNETRNMSRHESFAIGDDGNVIVSDHGYRPIRDNASEWLAAIDADDIVVSSFMARWIAASLLPNDRAGIMANWSACHAMVTTVRPSERTVAGAYRADGKSENPDRDDAGKRAEMAGTLIPFMAGTQSFDRVPRMNESGNTTTSFGKDGTWKIGEPFTGTVRIMREQPVKSLLAEPIFGVLGGNMESRTDKDDETKRNLSDWQDRFMAEPLPDTKIGKRIMVAMETNRAMLEGVATLASSIGIPVPSWTRNMPTFGESFGRLVGDYYVVGAAKSENVIVDWSSLHHDLFGTVAARKRTTDIAMMQRMVRRMAMNVGADLCTERCPANANHSHGCPNGNTGTTVATFRRVRPVTIERMVPTFTMPVRYSAGMDDRTVARLVKSGGYVTMNADPTMAGVRVPMFHAWSDRINAWMDDTMAGYRTMVASLKASANHSADVMERERLALSIEWGISATFRDEHCRMVARHAARVAR